MKLTTTTIIALFAIGALAAPAPVPDQWNGAGSIDEWKEDLKNKVTGGDTGVDWQKKEDEKKKQDDWQKQEDEKKKQDDWQKKEDEKKNGVDNKKQDDWQKKEDEKKKNDDWQKKEDEKKKNDDWQKKEDEKKKNDDWQKKEDEKKKEEDYKKQPDWQKKEDEKKKQDDWQKDDDWYKKEDEKKKHDDWQKQEDEKKKQHPDYKQPEYKPDYKEHDYKEPDNKDKGKTYFIPVVYDDKKPQQGPDYGKSDDGYKFTYTKSFEVKATPDQVINTDQVPTPGQPGAYGIFDFYLNPHIDQICYNITLFDVSGDYKSPARTATHIHEAVRGRSGPPRIAFPNPVGDDHRRNSYGCLTGPFTTGVNAPGTTTDTGTGFKVQKIVDNPAGFFADSHTVAYPAGVVRGQLA